jgi:Protein of unknown function (DUF2000)
MPYENNVKKFVVVINRHQPLPVIANAMAHVAFGIAGKGSDVGRLLNYSNTATGFLAKIDESPFIILDAKNSSQLLALLNAAMVSPHVTYNLFTTSMIGPSAEAQITATRDASLNELDLVAVLLYGARENIDPLTKRYSLFKG